MVDFIHNNKDLYGVDAICRILPIAASTYYRTLDGTVANRDLSR
ncbi:Mobile element protein [Acinetobacter bereziniae]|nr:Mobile element protein [Acinetobacter bereziniae]